MTYLRLFKIELKSKNDQVNLNLCLEIMPVWFLSFKEILNERCDFDVNVN